jgi:parallel beta-helix repeat protein
MLLASTLPLVLNTQPANASGTIYIRADGSVDPPTAPISSFDNVTYTFTDNVNESIVVERDNIVVNGDGYTVSGTGSGRGIDLTGRSNVTVKNAVVVEFKYGIYLHGGSSITLFENNLTANTGYGILLDGSSNNNIIGNNVVNNSGGIKLDYLSNSNNISSNNITANKGDALPLYTSKHNNLSGNYIARNKGNGILLDGASSNTTLRNNKMAENTYNFGILNPWGFTNLINDIDVSNTVDGKPIYYWINKHNMTVPLDAGYVALVNCSNINVRNSNLTDNGQGLLLARTTNSTITQNKIANNLWFGIWFSNPSHGNTIFWNNIANNSLGITVTSSSNCNISYNNIVNNGDGVWLSGAWDSIVSHNNITDNDNGIVGTASNCNISRNIIMFNGFGIDLSYSNNNNVSHNIIAKNDYDGIDFDSSENNSIFNNNMTSNDEIGIGLTYSSNNNTISNNNILDNRYGISFSYSSNDNRIFSNNIANHSGYAVELDFDPTNNLFYHNNFINNTGEVATFLAGSNTWDIGYPEGGNYWTKYKGVDYKHGPDQDQPGSDGVGDTPRTINADNRDRYPLMKPYPWDPHDIAITSITTSKTVVGQGYTLDVTVMVFNYGTHAETFNVTAYANTTVIGTIAGITLLSRNSTTVNFTWNTTGFAEGNYTIKACAIPVDGETDTEDNNYTNGWIIVTIPGDADGNGHVFLYDLTILGTAWDSRPGDPHWWANADIDSDLHVYLYDLTIIGSHWDEVAS